jgi:hypothetical protein
LVRLLGAVLNKRSAMGRFFMRENPEQLAQQLQTVHVKNQ